MDVGYLLVISELWVFFTEVYAEMFGRLLIYIVI